LLWQLCRRLCLRRCFLVVNLLNMFILPEKMFPSFQMPIMSSLPKKMFSGCRQAQESSLSLVWKETSGNAGLA
jgi:hypothetical protein